MRRIVELGCAGDGFACGLNSDRFAPMMASARLQQAGRGLSHSLDGASVTAKSEKRRAFYLGKAQHGSCGGMHSFGVECRPIICRKSNLFPSRRVVTSVAKSAITGKEYYDM